ncbi:MAG: DUF1292 domain-containing protein [Clostridia bacterium]|nr:DUF1292 domain-containing protein [Clostridia bacterium]
MDEELDLVVISDDEGNEQTMEVLDYFYYEGEEYAILVQYNEDEQDEDDEEGAECDCGECGAECDYCHGEQQEAYIMRVSPIGDDQEEFVPVDEDLLSKLIDFVQNDLYADEDEEDEFVDEEEEEGDE